MSSKRYFFANNINPFIGLLGLSQSFSFFLAGEGGGGDPLAPPNPTEVGCRAGRPNSKCDLPPAIARGEDKSSPGVAGVATPADPGEAVDKNSKRLNLSQRSGVRIASGWLGGKQISPTDNS